MILPELHVDGEPFTGSGLCSDGLEFVSTSGLTSVPTKYNVWSIKVKTIVDKEKTNKTSKTC